MLKELYTAAMGMLPQQTRLEVISNNMANANTSGYKREEVFERNLIDATSHFYNVAGDAEQDDPPIGSFTDFAAGAYSKTDNPLDIAIEERGFFEVQDEDGNRFMTRSGKFQISTDGYLQAMDGKNLIGQDGPIQVSQEFLSDTLTLRDSREIDIRISQSGEIFAHDNFIGRLKILDVNDLNTLRKDSAQYFTASELTEIRELSQEAVNVRQGWLEGSNVDIIKEMVSMIELQRNFEAGSKVISTNDGTLTQSIALSRFY